MLTESTGKTVFAVTASQAPAGMVDDGPQDHGMKKRLHT